MKKIKIFPAPHMEIRIHVSKEMERDLRMCRELAEKDDFDGGGICDGCSWDGVEISCTCMCELPEVQRQVLGGAE